MVLVMAARLEQNVMSGVGVECHKHISSVYLLSGLYIMVKTFDSGKCEGQGRRRC